MKGQASQKTLKQLFFPIFGEMLLFMFVGSVDTLMLSGAGDDKVGAVGAANTYMSLFTMAFSIISNGMLAVMTQYIGAGKEYVAKQARWIGLLFNGCLGFVVSLLLIFWTRPIQGFLGVAGGLMADAVRYMKVVGGGCFLVAVTPIFTSYLRAFGYTRESLYANIISNGMNVILNAVFLYVFKWGVTGVAWATVISRISGLVMLIVVGQIKIRFPDEAGQVEHVPARTVCYAILKIGFPSALETALYNVAMSIVMKFVNQMSADGIYVTVKSYASQIVNFSYCAGASLANANAVMTGWRIGEKKLEECRKETRPSAWPGSGLLSACLWQWPLLFPENIS